LRDNDLLLESEFKRKPKCEDGIRFIVYGFILIAIGYITYLFAFSTVITYVGSYHIPVMGQPYLFLVIPAHLTLLAGGVCLLIGILKYVKEM